MADTNEIEKIRLARQIVNTPFGLANGLDQMKTSFHSSDPVMKFAVSLLDWDAIKEKIRVSSITLYAERFSLDELRQMAGFYCGPLGEKIYNENIKIGTELGKEVESMLKSMTKDKIDEMGPDKVMQKIKEIMDNENQKPGP